MKKIIVQKYGGTSVENIKKMKNIVNRVIKLYDEGHSIVLVISAMGKTTDHLVEMAKAITENPDKRELDMLISTGEQVSVSLISIIFKSLGYDSISLTGYQAGIVTSSDYNKGKIADIDISKIKKYLQEKKIVIVAGFQGITENGDITTLGRGGSDTTAVALAAKLQSICEIYTDVDGIYAIDPKKYKNAQLLSEISYEEMMELSNLGAKVMEMRSVEMGKIFNVPIHIGNSVTGKIGTIIKDVDQLTGLATEHNVAMVTISDVLYQSGDIYKIFNLLSEGEINIDMISQTEPIDGKINVSLSTPSLDVDSLKSVLKDYHTHKLYVDENMTKISVVGIGMIDQSGVASKLFNIFDNLGIHFKQVTTSEISISFIVNNEDSYSLIEEIAKAFNLSNN